MGILQDYIDRVEADGGTYVVNDSFNDIIPVGFSKIIVTFHDIPIALEVLDIQNDLSAEILSEEFVVTRDTNQVSEIAESVSECAFNYAQALELDYNSTNLYIIVSNNNTVEIEAVQEGVTFSELINTTSGKVTTSLENADAPPSLAITDILFSEADTDVCNNIKVNVTTNELATKVTTPVVIDPNTNNPFSFDWVRGTHILISVETGALTASAKTQTPAILSVASTTLTVANTPTGGTLTVTHTSTYGLNIEYSIDDVTYQTSNTFTGLTAGDYTLYVRDQYGCEFSTGFAVSIFSPDISVTTPDAYISEGLSIRYKRDVDWGGCSDYKTEENTLSCENNVLLPYQAVQQWLTCDSLETQFRTNYANYEANVIKSDGTKDAMSIVEVTNNLGKTDKRDATYIDLGNDQTGIYFTQGNTYDYVTGFQNGTYELNGLLPEWGMINNYVNILGGWFTIIEIRPISELNADVLVIENTYTGIPTVTIVSSEYNLQNWNFYEFTVDMSVYENQIFQIEILLQDNTFGDVRWLSEFQESATELEETTEFIWYNAPANTDINYFASNIKNKARIELQTFHAGIDGNVSVQKTDSSIFLVNSLMNKTNTMVTVPMTLPILRQMAYNLFNSEVYVNREKYVLSEIPEIEPYGQTNLYVLTAVLLKDGRAFGSQINGVEQIVEGVTELTGLLSIGGGGALKIGQ